MEVLIEKNENIHEKMSSTATKEVISSSILTSDLLVICREVITTRQNPKRFVEVLNMCGEVVFAIVKDNFKLFKKRVHLKSSDSLLSAKNTAS